jgi:hypothetical protein
MHRRSNQVVVVLCSSITPSVVEIEQAKNLAIYKLPNNCEVSAFALRDPRMGDDLYATIFLVEKT